MMIKCALCGEEIEIPDEVELQEGQHVRCPFCKGKFSYHATLGLCKINASPKARILHSKYSAALSEYPTKQRKKRSKTKENVLAVLLGLSIVSILLCAGAYFGCVYNEYNSAKEDDSQEVPLPKLVSEHEAATNTVADTPHMPTNANEIVVTAEPVDQKRIEEVRSEVVQPCLVAMVQKNDLFTHAGSFLYCIIDVSGGVNATKYPVSYVRATSSDVFNTDEYKTAKIVLRKIPAGTFMMGSPPNEQNRQPDEMQHEVKISSPFYMGVFEVTQKQYELVTGSTPSKIKGDKRPVEYVSWNVIRGNSENYNWPSSSNVDPVSFVGKLRAKTGIVTIDLPTEAKWEYACRAGATSAYCNGGNGEDDLKLVGRYKGNMSERRGGYSSGHTTVGSYSPNAWGLYDMHGNVFEWCLDYHGEYPANLQVDPVGPDFGSFRARRGGWSEYGADSCRAAYRGFHKAPTWRSVRVGFRLSCSADDKDDGEVLASLSAPKSESTNARSLISPKVNMNKKRDSLLECENSADINWNYTLKDNEVIINSIPNDTVGMVRVPSTIKYYPVKYIGSFAFYGCKRLTGVILPDYVQSIGKKAFANCTALERVTGASNVQSIAKDAFTGCSRLRERPVVQTISLESSSPLETNQRGSPGSSYLVVDLSDGPNVKRYPVSWLDRVPENGWTDEYKTTKLVLRRIMAGMFNMGSPENECGREGSEKQHRVTLTKPYYIGVFEVTRKQYSLVTGKFVIGDSNDGMRPMSSVSWEDIRGNRFDHDWPTVGGRVDKASFMGILRTKTGITTFDLPTEARWEYACRAGTTTSLNNGKNLTSKYKSVDLEMLGRYSFNGGNEGEAPDDRGRKGESIVGFYRPNMLGLYDMHGNVWEWCLDKFSYFDGKSVVDPVGSASDNPDHGRVVKGGSYMDYACSCRSSSRSSHSPTVRYGNYGFRVCCDAIGVAHTSASSTLTALSLSVENPIKDTWPVLPRPNQWEPPGQMASVHKYKARISCIVPRNSRETVMVEVYFITDTADGRGREKIEDMQIFSFEFGGEKHRMQKFEFSSPEVKARRIEDGGPDYRRVKWEGVRYKGCIIRVLHNGKILKVITKPSNQAWLKAGREPVVTFGSAFGE